jgi:hypothetical protein
MEKKRAEKRKHARINTVNLVSYICLDADGNELKKGMGKTLNISQGGVLLETHIPIKSEFILLMAIDLEDNLIEIKGQIAYSRPAQSGMYQTGIRFLGPDSDQKKIISVFIKSYFKRKNRGATLKADTKSG